MKGLLLFSSLRRHLPAAAGLLLAPALIMTSPGVADAAPRTTDRADAAAGWLGRQLDADTFVMNVEFGGQTFPDYGLTADTVLALDAAKVGRRAANRATRALKRHVVDYTSGGNPNDYYAGSFAKLLLVAAAQDANPRSFGGSIRADLVTELKALECGRLRDCSAANKGRFSDVSEFGDFSSIITQSLSLIALERTTKAGPSRAAVAFLGRQQCADGGFPQLIGETTCTGSVDATGFAVQALVSTGTKADTELAARAGRWLARQQNGNGSLTGDGVRNANSTALAAQAFDALGLDGKARKARAFLRSLQVGCAGDRADRGSVRYSRTDNGDAVRATAQAVPALAKTVLVDISRDGARRALPRLAC